MKRSQGLSVIAGALVALLFACGPADDSDPHPEQIRGWTWIAGSDLGDQTATYGTKGRAAAINVPGARESAVSWADPNGTLWLFGGTGPNGEGFTGNFNDLWKYDQNSKTWTWVAGNDRLDEWGRYGAKGVPDRANVPGARESAVSWTDTDGRLWLFGGWGVGGDGNWGWLNDLWRYDPATNAWTWISGRETMGQAGAYGTKGVPDPTNVPGARSFAATWIDIYGQLWLFGGRGYDSVGDFGSLNDLWNFDPETLAWTWVTGSRYASQKANYGTKGQASPSNDPGGIAEAVTWIDSGNSLWLFGGGGYNAGYLNALWKFNPYTSEWTWVSGSNFGNQPGSYGAQGVASPTNAPGARVEAAAWYGSSGELWLFGGYGYSDTDDGHLNDLWKFDATTFEWTWVSGTRWVDQPGNYGTKGTAGSINKPGGRSKAVSWIDSLGYFWLFGGAGYDSLGQQARLNDLWRYVR